VIWNKASLLIIKESYKYVPDFKMWKKITEKSQYKIDIGRDRKPE
jgi:hypothetical protein